jgi:polyhydroxyalkanoate synthase
MAGAAGAATALPFALNGALPWHETLREEAAALMRQAAAIPPERLTAAVLRQSHDDMGNMLKGIRLYQQHPYRRRLPEVRTAWAEGSAVLRDFGGGGRPVLFVPSLVNRSDVLDLMPDHSLVRWLAARGAIRPLLLDWGCPGGAERDFGLSDYVTGPLDRALTAASALAGGPVPVVGYCMGGTLSAALAQTAPDRVGALALLAAPWDFHADIAPPARQFASATAMWRPVLDALGQMPPDILQAFFAALDPGLAERKFAAFARRDMDSDGAARFVALEDWVNDGVPLTARVAIETLGGWFGENVTARSRWLIGGRIVRPDALRLPVFAAIPLRDRIVPPASARALTGLLADPTVIEPDAGHIGMVVGGTARDSLWQPLESWLSAPT